MHHNHDKKIVGLPDDIKLEVRRLYSLGITKPNGILKYLETNQFTLPKKTQLSTFLKTLRLVRG